MSRSTRSRTRTTTSPRRTGQMIFHRRNYVLLAAGVLAVVVGYVIMRFENEVDGFISLFVAPILILAGYLEIIYAILWRPKEDAADRTQTAA